MAIGISVKKAEGEYDLGESKFFGGPTIPHEWEDKIYEDAVFVCQIRLSDIRELDKENKLPHTGYLYFFMDTQSFPYTPLVYYYNGEPDMVIDAFNECEPGFEHLTQEWLISFSEVEDDSDGIKLLGVPSDWPYEEEPLELLLQFDPLAAPLDFLDDIDGYAYYFFGEDRESFADVTLHIERS